MALARAQTFCFQGIDALTVDVQAQLSPGLPAFHLVGLPDKAVAESKERVRSALYSLGLALPAKRITINLAPADLRKEGSHYDLPIALALLGAIGALSPERLQDFVALGELSLDGHLISVGKGLSAALGCSAQGKHLICPEGDGSDAAWAGDLQIIAPPSLFSLLQHIKGTQVVPAPRARYAEKRPADTKDMKDIQGQSSAKRAALIAAAGGHHLLLMGPPGVGKSMLAERMTALMPDLTPEEALEVTLIHSMSAGSTHKGLITQRPFRTPHHSCSLASLIGGGMKALPGEISLAHCGVLFLDELPEFSRSTLEALRQPLESKQAVIARANHHVTYPANIQLVGAMNPCPCGYLGDRDKQCPKAPACSTNYQNKLSGPLWERFDMILTLRTPSLFSSSCPTSEPSTADMKKNIARAWQLQQQRATLMTQNKSSESSAPLENSNSCFPADHKKKNIPMIQSFLNGHRAFSFLEPLLNLNKDAEDLLNKTAAVWKLSLRGYHKSLRIARTIADLENSDAIKKIHMAEALSYRPQRVSMQKAA